MNVGDLVIIHNGVPPVPQIGLIIRQHIKTGRSRRYNPDTFSDETPIYMVLIGGKVKKLHSLWLEVIGEGR